MGASGEVKVNREFDLTATQVNGIVTLQSGVPFTVNLGTDQANIGSGPAQRLNALTPIVKVFDAFFG